VTSSAERSVPTVVVARTPRPGREREFERWLRKLAAGARQAPGHVRTDVQAPDDAHPGEWVIVYRFDDVASLQAWLTSPTREALVAEGHDLLLGEPREQVLALPVEHETVTAVASFRVRPGFEDRHAAALEQLLDRLRRAPGFVRSEVFEPVAGVQDETVVVFAFDGREHLDQWLASRARREALAEIDELVEGERTVNVVGGFGGWFGEPGMVDVKRWKQALVVLLALFPTSLVLTVVRGWLLPDAGLVLAVLFGNVLGVIVLSWLLMPALTKLLADWLRR
jgi:antibiotic biosynthesis monooxygenase (ABM) superfamily enzyme